MTTATATATKCGTYAGAQAHAKYGTQPCSDCRRARRDYMRDYRAANEERRNQESHYNSARSRALTRLSKLHPAQFDILLDQELGR